MEKCVQERHQERHRKMTYQDLRKFLAASELSNREFADLAGLKKSTFQAMLGNESRIRFDAFLQIYDAMTKICNESVGTEAYDALVRAKIAFLNSYRKAEDIDTDAMLTAIHANRNAIHGEYEDRNKEKLLACYNKLNEDGRQEAVKRVEDLTYNPTYKKNED